MADRPEIPVSAERHFAPRRARDDGVCGNAWDDGVCGNAWDDGVCGNARDDGVCGNAWDDGLGEGHRLCSSAEIPVSAERHYAPRRARDDGVCGNARDDGMGWMDRGSWRSRRAWDDRVG